MGVRKALAGALACVMSLALFATMAGCGSDTVAETTDDAIEQEVTEDDRDEAVEESSQSETDDSETGESEDTGAEEAAAADEDDGVLEPGTYQGTVVAREAYIRDGILYFPAEVDLDISRENVVVDIGGLLDLDSVVEVELTSGGDWVFVRLVE